jgi:hypothetical protein
MKWQLKQLLRKDRQQSFNNEASLIEAAMGSNSSAKAGFQLLQKWYKRRCRVSLLMLWRRLNDVAEEHQALYSIKTPPGDMFPLEATKAKNFEVLDLQLTNDELRAAAMRLKTGKAPGPNQFCQDTVWDWAKGEFGTKSATNWAERIYDTGEVPSAMKEGVLVLIPKQGTKSSRSITLLDTVYKLIA